MATSVSAKDLETQWDVRGIDPDGLTLHRGTAFSPRLSALETVAEPAATLPAMVGSGADGSAPPLALGEELGRGGMGVVRAATQIALGRQVAVKAPRLDSDRRLAGPMLLREARVTGALEHPNVIPVYALGRDDQGHPLIVMRRIEGESWAAELSRASPEERLQGGYLLRHLGILKQVALAVHFAHDKGVLHRDIKPDNVMLGGYGEVYLADWGIAVTLEGSTVLGLPKAAEVTQIEGTPAYMSPEMAVGNGALIGPQTDVYLLGAVLHEIVMGSGPHVADRVRETLVLAFESKPHVYPTEVPRGLVEICHRAMARAIEDRYAGASEVADALDEYLRHRASLQLSDEARGMLSKFETLSEKPDLDAEGLLQIHRLFNQCRFAFEHALRDYPENEEARRGRSAVLGAMIAFELGRGAPGAAEALLREMDDPPAELVLRVSSALRERARSAERLRSLERDADTAFGARQRARLVLLVAVLWGAILVACGFLSRTGVFEVTHTRFALLNVFFLIVVGTSVVFDRATLLGNAVNRRLSAISSVVFAGNAALWIALDALAIDRPDGMVVHALMGGVVWATAAVTVEKRWWWMPVAQVIAVFLIARFPLYHYELLGSLLTLGSVAITVFARFDAETQVGGYARPGPP